MVKRFLLKSSLKGSCGVGFVASNKRSRKVIDYGIEAVKNLTHRGAVSADGKTGDGAGVMIEIPEKLKKLVEKENKDKVKDRKEKDIGIGVAFIWGDEEFVKDEIEKSTEKFGRFLKWREVPVDEGALGKIALEEKPKILHFFVEVEGKGKETEKKLFLIRKIAEKEIKAKKRGDVYFPSISTKKIVYKGLFISTQIDKFYLDLQDKEFESKICIFHQRYSTNTHPHWKLAHPMRFIAHNGEINTLWGNINWFKAREKMFEGEEFDVVKPVIDEEGSDSAILDNVIEFIYLFSDRDLVETILMLIPPAYEWKENEIVKSFYEYHDILSEPWDGPAAIAFSDGEIVGAHLDRNGLRPARFIKTKEFVIMGSEVGLIEIPKNEIEFVGRLGPGDTIIFNGELKTTKEIEEEVSKRKPYYVWVEKIKRIEKIDEISEEFAENGDKFAERNGDIRIKQKLFGYTEEDIERFFEPMAEEGKESTFSMGDDTPLAFFSNFPRPVFHYFKQRFAQVTNPPIDPYRESIVMSLNTFIGQRWNILKLEEDNANVIKIASPIITKSELEDIKKLKKWKVFKSVFKKGLKEEIIRVRDEIVKSVKEGVEVVIISDKIDVNEDIKPIPSALITGAVHQKLIEEGIRLKTSIILETGEPREEHHFAVLLGVGADAILPYLAYETASKLAREKGKNEKEFVKNYKSAVEKGIMKIMSKMGISVVSSYKGAGIFEIIGLHEEVVSLCFKGIPAWFTKSGVRFDEIERDYEEFLIWAKSNSPDLPFIGFFRFRKGAEYHDKNPQVFKPLQKFVETGDINFYKEFSKEVQSRPPTKIRDFFEIKPVGEKIPIEEVEKEEEIVKRFYASSMSFGALSREAHETLAEGANMIGAWSSSGEGGEDPERFKTIKNCRVKQIASGRFGVTVDYAIHAQELEIKIAQGSKPGEGGQLPGIKVTEEIARVRHAIPGISLISPPPHHDIYSIEDLAQLIYDLKKVNPNAKVSVKLVSEAGVGIIASGVVKAYADNVHIAGHDGGTGASPSSSIKNAGSPIELGLAETQAILSWNDLRERVRIRVDGGLLNGWDVVKLAVLGADLFGFGTPTLIAMGCVMARQCHLNTCPTGVATQKEELRKKFKGKPENVARYFLAIAREVREILANLGVRKLDEIIGRIDLIKGKDNIINPKTKRKVDIYELLEPFKILKNYSPPNRRWDRNTRPETEEENLEYKIVKEVEKSLQRIKMGEKIELRFNISNVARSVGATLSGFLAKSEVLTEEEIIKIEFFGTAGQSFGAFLAKGITFILNGIANDYVGKALSGGKIIVKFRDSRNDVVVGNVCLYGATSGWMFVGGKAGERYAIRNSGAITVIEGAGDHLGEYMTGGIFVAIGDVGKNIGAGMTGGIGFILKQENLERKIMKSFVFLKEIDELESLVLTKLISLHSKYTGFNADLSPNDFLVVVPKEFQKYKNKYLNEIAEKINKEIS